MSYNVGNNVVHAVVPDRGKDFEELQKKSGELRGQIAEAEVRLADLTLAIDQVAVELKKQESAVTQEKALLVETRARTQELAKQAEAQAQAILLEARQSANKLLVEAQEKIEFQQKQLEAIRDTLGRQDQAQRERNVLQDNRERNLNALEGRIKPQLDEIEKQKHELQSSRQDLATRAEALSRTQKELENEANHQTILRSAFDSEVLAFEEKVKHLNADRAFLREEESRLGKAQEDIIAKEKALEEEKTRIEEEKQKMISDRNSLALLEQDLRNQRINLDRREAQVKARENTLAESLKK